MNPFLDSTFPPAWDAMCAKDIEPALTTALTTASHNISQITTQALSGATYQSSFADLEDATADLDRAWGRVQHLDSVANSEDLRDALNAMLPTVTAFYASIPLNKELWEVLQAVYTKTDRATLPPVHQRHMEESYAAFINAGAALEGEQKVRYATIQSELSSKTQKFSENVLDSTNAWELVLEEDSRLSGLPSSAIEAARESALEQQKGSPENPHYRFTLHQTSLIPLLQYAEDETLRKEVWTANQKVGRTDKTDNTNLAWDILALRQEKAQLLGFKNFADWATQRRMAQSGLKALQFIENLQDKVDATFQNECKSIEEYKARKTNSSPAQLEPWETLYWSQKQRKEELNYDSEELRPYFPLQSVMDGMFDLAARLFAIEVTPIPNDQSWNPEVSFYRITDQSTQEHLGSFYADWHPRSNKRGGAWMNSFETGAPAHLSQARTPHLGLICGNMTKPVGDTPALMTHNEVTTIFHEFGHLLHQLLSEVPVKSLSGTNVAWDFVELPSQLMENFCWHRESLDLFARHHRTGDTIPEDLFTRMLRAKNYRSATGFMRQLAFAKLDLSIHLHPPDSSRSWEEIESDLIGHYQAPSATPTASMIPRFSHLFSSATGYAAGYYSYKWAEVLEADAFMQFQNEGLLNRDTGMRFRNCILARGNSAPPAELYKEFTHAEPAITPLLEREGLL